MKRTELIPDVCVPPQVLYSQLMPAHNPMSEKAHEFQYSFMKSGGVKLIVDMLTKNHFLSNADVTTRR